MKSFISVITSACFVTIAASISISARTDSKTNYAVKRDSHPNETYLDIENELQLLFNESYRLSPNDTEKIEDQLIKFDERLKSFIGAKTLDFQRFELEKDDINQTWLNMSQSFDKSSSYELDFYMGLAKNVSDAIAEASMILKKFDDSTYFSDLLLCEMVNVHLQLMNLRAWNGKLATQYGNHIDVLIRFHHKIYSIKKTFRILALISPETLTLFKQQSAKTVSLLDDLGAQEPSPEYLMQ